PEEASSEVPVDLKQRAVNRDRRNQRRRGFLSMWLWNQSGESCPAFVNQILEPVCRNIQGGGIERILLFTCRGALRTQDLVDLVFDLRQVRLLVGVSNPVCQSVERIQRLWLRVEFVGSQKLPARCQYRGKCAQCHRSQEDNVAPFVQKRLLRPVVELRSTWMNGKIGTGVGIGRLELRQHRKLANQVSPRARQSL